MTHTLMGPDYPPPKPGPDDEFRMVKPEQMLGIPVTWQAGRSTLTIPLVLAKQPYMPLYYPLDRGEVPIMKAGKQNQLTAITSG
jgi:hypothetical protein